jgi:N-acetylglutamate synthase-like GNAT family acetyltransferase
MPAGMDSTHIEYLADFPEATPILAAWHHAEWRDVIPDWPREQVEADLRAHTGRRQIPTTFVAVEGDRFIGSASLLAEDLEGWKQLGPWLASVYVVPQCRRRGIGSRLVTRVVEEARALGIPTLHLWTPDRQDYYLRLGWQFVTRTHCGNAEVTIMRKSTMVWSPLPDEQHRRSQDKNSGRGIG